MILIMHDWTREKEEGNGEGDEEGDGAGEEGTRYLGGGGFIDWLGD